MNVSQFNKNVDARSFVKKTLLKIIHQINVSITLTRILIPNLPDTSHHENRVMRQSIQK